MRLVATLLAATIVILATENAFPTIRNEIHPAEPSDSSSRLHAESGSYNYEEHSGITGSSNSDIDNNIDEERGSPLGTDGLKEEERGLFSWYFLLGPLFKSPERAEAVEKFGNARIWPAIRTEKLENGQELVIPKVFKAKNAGTGKGKTT
ncbi:hypothetical protein F441_05951 [Phytophthora nicotianae CJ01A1]|uniref:RxLR effector protein n=5 Tax=Phytophthora nicotianae TaxID=4792 RepID=W2RBI6_PHYN3|nr:hypothetical protein PPTG_02112 [Phytophthora nicotianae INRA-310]ETI50542.1 hypothetical protein F443_05945 [Phytophthora nicotianae P1569]ETK90415.1 hypothetical protein L915_05823 [Phytophthora nicotianae]ETP20313.1 hypothetical protein F441_05951 [Phytophthora nicotianae CJ01A1]ETL96997.1 hypothetical protein L917_05645 [Phytophthora nicotianae]ETN22059.1 hypothetical protein PPTG_02112 [Phytophthora nicotianae INRA-310]